MKRNLTRYNGKYRMNLRGVSLYFVYFNICGARPGGWKLKLNKIYKKDCIGRVPSSIADLETCSLCQNEDVCMSLWGGSQVIGRAPETASSGEQITRNTKTNKTD
jgi:hypothetical protein